MPLDLLISGKQPAAVWIAVLSLPMVIAAVNDLHAAADDCPIIFPHKIFTDTGDAVSVTGTLTGNGVPYKYNTRIIECFRDRRECSVTIVDSGAQTDGICHIFVDNMLPLQIIQWNKDQIIATTDARCDSNLYMIDRRAKTVQITMPSADPCAVSELGRSHSGTTYHWTIEEPSFWSDFKVDPEEAIKKLTNEFHK